MDQLTAQIIAVLECQVTSLTSINNSMHTMINNLIAEKHKLQEQLDTYAKQSGT